MNETFGWSKLKCFSISLGTELSKFATASTMSGLKRWPNTSNTTSSAMFEVRSSGEGLHMDLGEGPVKHR